MSASQRLQLELHGFEVFLPLVETKRASAPLFASYFFVHVIDRWSVINRCIGVVCLVRVGDCPSKMPDAEIARLKAMSDAHGLIRLPNKPSARHVFAKGAQVKIIGGALQGVTALHSGMSAGEREILLIAMLARPGGSQSPVISLPRYGPRRASSSCAMRSS